jgi:RNA polymerase sigma-70 factor, ECF subfamily
MSAQARHAPLLKGHALPKQPSEVLFEEQMLPHLDALYRGALSMTRSPQDADDLVQDTFVRAYQFIDSFRVGTNARAWLFRILTNLFINRYRKSKREPEQSSFEEMEDFFLYNRLQDAYLSGKAETPESVVLGKVQVEAIQDAISRLPDEYRDTVILADVNELSYQEISEILEVPIGTVRSRLSRGRRLVQRTLWAFTEENPR